MNISQHPESLSLLGNLQHLIIQCASTEKEVTMEVWLGAAEESDALVTHTYNPNNDGIIDVDLKDVVGAQLSFSLRDLSAAYAQNGIARTFSVRATCGQTVWNNSFTVVRAGVANLADSVANFLEQNFLTWQPSLKAVTYYTPEFLTYYAQTAVTVKYKAYRANNTVIGSGTLASIPSGSCYTVPTGYAVIAGLTNSLPGYYDVWVENGSGERLTYIQRYYAGGVKSEQEEWILFENSLGGVDTFRAYGDSENEASHEHKIAEIEEELEEYRVDTERKYKKSTGYLDKNERRWLLDFFPSTGKYLYADQLVRKIVVTDDDVNYTSKELPSEYSFTYRFASVKPYMNLPRTTTSLSGMHIESPDVGSFTIAPRLVEFPRQELSGGALFPVQNPYSQQWGTTTFSALAIAIARWLGIDFDSDAVRDAINRLVDGGFLSRVHDDTAEGHITFAQGLTALGNILLGNYAEGLRGGKLTPEGFAELKGLWVRELSTFGDGTVHQDENGNDIPAIRVQGDAIFSGNLSTPYFVSNFPGGIGWAIQKKAFVNAAGVTEYKYVLECDGANFRETLRVYSLIASQLLGENDNRIITAMMEVHHYDPETGKVWLNTNCGKLYNTLRPGDYIMVQQFQPGNDVASGGDGYITKHYELIVNQVGTGGATDENGDRLDWVTISSFTPGVNQEGTAETLITKGDTFCRVDSLTDAERKGIIQMISVGTNAPYMDIQYGLKTDPQHALKARLGNLSGLRTDDFGQLDNFGIYSNRGYFTGEFRNAQTGESLSARITTTQAQHVSLYKETTYDIGEDDNLVSNGFFVRELESWAVCTTSGAALDTQGVSGILYSGGMPLMVNGKVMSTSDKGKAIITDYDGVPMLKLSGAGVSQSFSSMDPNTTHKELTTENGSETADVPDTLYMGIRILPITEGTLKVEFLKQDGTTSGWQRTVVSTAQWMTVQSQDTTQAPWDYTGTGKMIVSYTGECLIRFVVLMNDPIESSRVDYWTKITQTARLIKAEANATYATRTMHSELSIEVGRIGTEVTNNKDASDRAKAAIEARLGDIETFDNNTATWITQTSNRLALWASSFDANGNVKDLAQLRIDVNSINTTIGTLATTAAMNSYVQQLQHDIDSIESDCNDNATAIRQTKSSLDLIAASFNADGTVKASGSIALYLAEEYSWIRMRANCIDFEFTEEWAVWSRSNKVMWIDSNGDIHYTGELVGSSVSSGNIYIGNNVNFYVNSEKFARFSSTNTDAEAMLYVRHTGGVGIRAVANGSNGEAVRALSLNGGKAIYSGGNCEFSLAATEQFLISGSGVFAPRCAVKTTSFSLPGSPTVGTLFLCKGTTSDLTITTTDYPIQESNGRSHYVGTNSSHNFAASSFMLLFTGGYWALFFCK